MYCSSLVECFISVLNGGLRSGGGLGDSLDQEQRHTSHYWERYLLDISFFVVVIIVMLNIIFGVILDGFAELRDLDKVRMEDIENRCLVCGLEKYLIESQ